jgi:Tol biopolymer transport system component
VWVDNDRVAFQSDREGDLGIFWQRADGTSPPARLTKPDDGDTAHVPESSSPDGKTLLFAVSKKIRAYSLASLSLPEKKATPLADIASIFPIAATFSPDGKWLAYTKSATEVIAPSVFVQPFPPTGGSIYQISKPPGIHPFWSPDGKELIYSAAPGSLVAVRVTTAPAFTFGNPEPVARGFIEYGPTVERDHDMLRDGRLLGTARPASTDAATAQQIQVVLNWFTELQQRVPTR